jgi:hypothetical protein
MRNRTGADNGGPQRVRAVDATVRFLGARRFVAACFEPERFEPERFVPERFVPAGFRPAGFGNFGAWRTTSPRFACQGARGGRPRRGCVNA